MSVIYSKPATVGKTMNQPAEASSKRAGNEKKKTKKES